MDDQTDSQLLRAYSETRSDEAFATLVRRHIDLVHSAAMRMVCDSHLAQDMPQNTFVALAKNVAELKMRPVITGWLHRTAQNIAAQTVRTDVRRRVCEQEVVAMNELLSATPDASWEHVAPHLDDALGELDETDRDAVLLRYFEKKSAREMAAQLGISDDAAQKRVSRAVDCLREFFAKRGVTVGASGLAVVISANAVQAAPVGLALTISTAAVLTGTTLATTATVTATKAIAMTAFQKTIVTATIAVLAGVGIYEARQASQLREHVQTLQQQQAPLVEQIQQLQGVHEKAIEQLATLREDNERLNLATAELPKLRGENARLRTSVQPQSQASTGYQASQVPIPPPTHAAEVESYPENLRNLAITNYDRAMTNLAKAKTQPERYLALSEAAKLALIFGKTEEAGKYATELLALDQQFKNEPWRGGDAVYFGNMVLG